MKLPRQLPLLAAGAWLVTGCASKPAEARIGQPASGPSEYVTVQSIESRIPRRIRIDELSNATLRGMTPKSTVTGEDNIREVLSRPFPVSRGGR